MSSNPRIISINTAFWKIYLNEPNDGHFQIQFIYFGGLRLLDLKPPKQSCSGRWKGATVSPLDPLDLLSPLTHLVTANSRLFSRSDGYKLSWSDASNHVIENACRVIPMKINSNEEKSQKNVNLLRTFGKCKPIPKCASSQIWMHMLKIGRFLNHRTTLK